MKKYYKRLKREAASIRLQATRKSEIKKHLAAFMEAHPVRVEAEPRQIVRENINYLGFLLDRMNMKIVYTALIVLLGGGGVAAAAEAAQPGDALYPVKVHVNEEVTSALKLSDASRAEWGVQRIERRLAESEKLQAEGKLDSAAQDQVDQLISAHVSSVRSLVNDLALAGDDAAVESIHEHLDGVEQDFDDTLTDLKLSTTTLDVRTEKAHAEESESVEPATKDEAEKGTLEQESAKTEPAEASETQEKAEVPETKEAEPTEVQGTSKREGNETGEATESHEAETPEGEAAGSLN